MCYDLFSNDVYPLNSENFADLVMNPKSNVGKKFVDDKSKNGTPFTVVLKTKIPDYVKEAIDDIETLSGTRFLREEVFGSSESVRPVSTDYLEKPLGLKPQIFQQQGLFVEVGVDIFTLSDQQKVYIYTTTNSGNSIEFEYGFISGVISRLKKQGKVVVAVDSFHTHPLNLVPSIMDKRQFQNELSIVKEEHPEIDFSRWKMGTTMETEPVVHVVDLNDWL